MRFSDLETIVIRPGVAANKAHRSVTRDGVEVFLSPQLFKIFLRIGMSKCGATPAQIFDALYANSIDGGPVTGRKAVQVQRCNLNRKLAPLGLRIKSAGSGYRDRAYELTIWLRPTDRAAPAQMLLSDFGFFDREEPAD